MPRKTTPKPKTRTTRKPKTSNPEDLLDIPKFLNRWVGTGKNKKEIIGYERDDKGKLIKVAANGDKFDAMTDKKIPVKKTSKKA